MYSEEVKRQRQTLADKLKRAIDRGDGDRERELEAEIKRLGDEAHAEANGKKKEPQKRAALLADAVRILGRRSGTVSRTTNAPRSSSG